MTEITRKHLEDAALAAGHKVYGWCVGDGGVTYYADIGPDESISWRPHLDDGDAFRLAAALLMYVDHRGTCATARVVGSYLVRVNYDTPSDATKAAREAVTLCAAAVGERLRGER